MITPNPQSLEVLRKNPLPAWLWDAARGRVVWANPAGITALDSRSLFELIDRVFDRSESGVEHIAALSKSLGPDETVAAELTFPSTGRTQAFSCACSLHYLADGRAGVLVVERAVIAAPLAIDTDVLQDAFAMLPSPVLLVRKDGHIAFHNDAARQLVSDPFPASLGQLIDPARAEKLLQRLGASNVTSSVEEVETPHGLRDIRLTFRRMERPGDIFATVMLDDITARLQLERQMSDNRPPDPEVRATADDEREAFAQIGISVQQEIASQDTHLEAIEPAPAEPQPESEAIAMDEPARDDDISFEKVSLDGGRLQSIPEPIKQAMERSGEAIIIAQKGQAVFATEQASKMFEFDDAESLLADSSIPSMLQGIQESRAEVKLPTRSGRLIDVDIRSTSIPWLHGPARQFRVRVAQANGNRNGGAERLIFRVDQARMSKPSPLVADPLVRRPVNPFLVEPLEPETDGALPTTPDEFNSGMSDEPKIEQKLDTPDAIPVMPSHDYAPTRELRAILDVVSDGIITLDSEGRILTFTAGAESIFGAGVGDVIGRPFSSLMTEESLKVVNDYLAALSGPGLASVFNDGREVIAKVKQGGTVPLFLTIGTLQTHDSDASFCAVVRDITAWKTTEKELREAKEQAENTSRQKSAFLTRVGHELRQPINAILGFSEMIKLERHGAISNDKYRGYAQDIFDSGTHLMSLINDLLDLSKVEAGKAELNFTAVNLNDVIDYAMMTVRQQAADRGVVLRKSVPDALPRIVADLRSMRQVLLNLVGNAIQYTDTGGQVIVSVKMGDLGDVTIRVKDSGIGMSDEQLAEAMEPFKRITTAGRDVPGTGLGLPLAKALAEANRASFEMRSQPEQGTVVDVSFPTTRVLAS